MVTTDPLLGRLVDGRYEVLERVARGGMATVYRALDRRLDREVALKVMHPHLAEGAEANDFLSRFRREARAAAGLTHHGVVAVFDQGLDGETSYLTMEYVPGTNLRREIRNGGMTVRRAFAILEQVLAALSVAHRKGVVHRDIKPENVLITAESGQVKVADFGLARAVTEVTSTSTGTVLGTVAYLAPEVISTGRCDARADVYAVGILAFEMLTGRLPHPGDTPIQIAFAHVNNDVPRPSSLAPQLGPAVDDMVCSFAARNPDGRPMDAAAALEVLRGVRHSLPDGVLDSVVGDPAAAAAAAAASDGGPASGTVAPARGMPPTTAMPAVGGPAEGARQGTMPTTMLPGRPGPYYGTPGQHAAPGVYGQQPGYPGQAMVPADRRPAGLTAGGAPPETPRLDKKRATGTIVTAIVLLVLLIALFGWIRSQAVSTATVPDGLTGLPVAEAESRLEAVGLVVAKAEQHDATVAEGSVISTDPASGATLNEGETVELLVSLGVDLIEVPTGVVGKMQDAASRALQDAGFMLGTATSTNDDAIPEGQVMAVSGPEGAVEEGASLERGTTLTLTVSAGPPPVAVPQVVGTAVEVARKTLEDLGLRVEVIEEASNDHEAGHVVAQDPENSTQVRRGDPVTLLVSTGPVQVEVPSVVDLSREEARTALEAAGFVVEVEDWTFAFTGDKVGRQVPGAGETANEGSTVTIAGF
ncbi:Stk1 family PASTA domain-containing Ser/Thr kinase [Antribacter gilvus]|uniref:Stk1 family PASTA domain-containing Ser/Thr kinase n=1 Tax=Antribacter gilvus TaxID=2304675 RepID=UPI000F793786|nr:Stk1 family PASTA domain-containing Ser/Thr kinase [Antribacter gilvus]